MAKGDAIYFPDVQSDIDMKNTYKLLNYPGSANAILAVNKTIYIDGVNGTSSGVRGTTSAYQTLDQALAVAQSGDTIVIRPYSYTVSAASVISVSGLSILGSGAIFTANSQTLGTVIRISADSVTIDGITVDGGRTASTSAQSWGTIEASGANTKIRNCVVKNTIGRAIRCSGNIDGLEISGCYISNFYQGIATDVVTGSTQYHIKVIDNSIYSPWATGGFPGGIKIDGTGFAGEITGLVSNNTLWGGQNYAAAEVGIEVLSAVRGISICNNYVSNYGYGISVDCPDALISGNNIRGASNIGIELVQESTFGRLNSFAVGNVIQGLKDSGTLAGGVGYSISSNSGTGDADIFILGGSVANCVNAVHSDRTTGITVMGLHTYQPSSGGNAPYSFQHSGNITVQDTVNELSVASAYGIYVDTDNGATTTGFHYSGNTFRYTVGGTLYPLFYFFTTSGTGTFNNVIINGTIANLTGGGVWGSGWIATSGATVNYDSLNNRPQGTDVQTTFQDAVKANNGITTDGSDFTFIDGGVHDSTAAEVFSNSHNLYLQYGSGGHIYIRKSDGTVIGTVSSTGLDFNGLSVATHAVETQNNKGQISGYASLDGSGKVPAAQLPTLSAGTIAVTSDNLKGDGAGNAIAVTATGTGDTVLATSPTLVTPTIGVATATSVNKWTLTAPSTAATLTAGADGLTYTLPEITTKIGFRHIPQNSQSAPYTTVLTDSGKHLYHPAADANNRTFTIDSNANVAYPIGTAIMFVNLSANNLSIAITADTMYLAGAGTTGTRTLAQYGKATAVKTGTTEWIISGVGLS